MLELFSSIIFLFIGYFFGRYHNNQKIVQEAIKHIKKRNAPKPGIIDYPTQADVEYSESGEEKVDAERLRVFQEQFKP